MKPFFGGLILRAWIVLALFPAVLSIAAADQVEMQNGDRYVGKVLSLNASTVVLQSEHLGNVSLARAKVSVIRFETPGAPAGITPAARTGTNSAASESNELAAKLASNTNLIARVQKQFLAGSSGTAQQKFDELVSGLLTGKLTVEDVRAQAKATAEQVRALRKDMDESSSWALDGYLAILDQFLGEEKSAYKPGTNAPAPKIQPGDLLEE